MLLTPSLILAVLSLMSADMANGQSAAVGSCPNDNTIYPSQLELLHTSDYYPSLNGGCQLFLDYKLCDGFITKIRFLTAQTVTWGLHIAVFRMAFINSYRLVGDIYINGVSTNDKGDHWVEFKPTSAVHVKYGDYLGMYYDETTENQGDLRRSLRSREFPRSYEKGSTQNNTANTLVWLRNATTLVVNQTTLTYGTSDQIHREPALYITLSRFPNPEAIAPGSKAYYQIYGKNSSSGSYNMSREHEMKFRDLRCNLNLPSNNASKCGNATTLRYFWQPSDRKCYAFLGCDSNKTASQNQQNQNNQGNQGGNQGGDNKKDKYVPWDNNFESEQQCRDICSEAANLRKPATTTTAADPNAVYRGVKINSN